MKTAIVYASVHHGNTKKLVENCLVVLRNRKPCMRRNIMKQIEEIIRNTTEEEQEGIGTKRTSLYEVCR